MFRLRAPPSVLESPSSEGSGPLLDYIPSTRDSITPLDVFLNSEMNAEQKEKEIFLAFSPRLQRILRGYLWYQLVRLAAVCQNNHKHVDHYEQLLSMGVIIAEPTLHASPKKVHFSKWTVAISACFLKPHG